MRAAVQSKIPCLPVCNHKTNFQVVENVILPFLNVDVKLGFTCNEDRPSVFKNRSLRKMFGV